MSANKASAKKATRKDVVIAHSGDYAAIEVVRHLDKHLLFEVYCLPEDEADEPLGYAKRLMYKSLLARDLDAVPTIRVDDTGRAVDPREVNAVHKKLYPLIQAGPVLVDFILMDDCAPFFESVASIVEGISNDKMYTITWVNNGRAASAYAAPLKRMHKKTFPSIINVFTEDHSCGLNHHQWANKEQKPCLCELALSQSSALMKNKDLVTYAEIYNGVTMTNVIETLSDFPPFTKEMAGRLSGAYKQCVSNNFAVKQDRDILCEILDTLLRMHDVSTVGTETYRNLMHCEKIARVDPLILPIANLAALPVVNSPNEYIKRARAFIHCSLGACLPASTQKDSSMSLPINHCYALIPEKLVDYLQSLTGK